MDTSVEEKLFIYCFWFRKHFRVLNPSTSERKPHAYCLLMQKQNTSSPCVYLASSWQRYDAALKLFFGILRKNNSNQYDLTMCASRVSFVTRHLCSMRIGSLYSVTINKSQSKNSIFSIRFSIDRHLVARYHSPTSAFNNCCIYSLLRRCVHLN